MTTFVWNHIWTIEGINNLNNDAYDHIDWENDDISEE
jgi:hypothetical protein